MILASATAVNINILAVRVTSLALLLAIKGKPSSCFGDVILGFIARSTPCRNNKYSNWFCYIAYT